MAAEVTVSIALFTFHLVARLAAAIYGLVFNQRFAMSASGLATTSLAAFDTQFRKLAVQFRICDAVELKFAICIGDVK